LRLRTLEHQKGSGSSEVLLLAWCSSFWSRHNRHQVLDPPADSSTYATLVLWSSTNHHNSLIVSPAQSSHSEMTFKIFRVFWPSRVSRASNKKGPDLSDKINALERQLRSYADDAQAGEETPLFGDVPDGNRRTAATPATYQTGEDSRNAPGYAGASTEYDLSRFEYSSKPIRIAAQLLRDLLLYLNIIIVWLFERWYRWLLVAIPIALYISTYKFIFRE
jgi:hypothetical protein